MRRRNFVKTTVTALARPAAIVGAPTVSLSRLIQAMGPAGGVIQLLPGVTYASGGQ